MKIYILSLGCSRNLLDSEILHGMLKRRGHDVLESPENSDIAIVNTCGFISDAKEESIGMILQLAELKKKGNLSRLIVTGCLGQRYPDELMKDMKEIDAVFGSSDYARIPDLIDSILHGERVKRVSVKPEFDGADHAGRVLSTPGHYAYIKVQEGCSNRCSYCVIPDIRGPLVSRDISGIAEEVRRIKEERDLKELIIVAQDTAVFGVDTKGFSLLPELLYELSPIMDKGWIRVLYTHPAHFNAKMISAVNSLENVCKYVDLPIQHINDDILRKMNRHIGRKGIEDLIRDIRASIEGAVIRTTVMVGFPGETDGQFKELMDFLKVIKFDRLGAFRYSREEGTPAAGFPSQVPEKIKNVRYDEVMRLQREISEENNTRYLSKVIKVLIDEKVEDSDGLFIGRGYMDAPEVDGSVHVRGNGIHSGQFVNVRVTGTAEYDLLGEAV
ncbi:MAG: 30S ribosomal protein S12 methylthiotransferase RimO [Candidatus Omnitrophica bacterium]|nr:30S ribosomal protein S12 methylthiotransferase RimO [Candidatus Omnitrophota bacterium]